MKRILATFAATAALAGASAPALADGVRADVYTGLGWDAGDAAKARVGATLGYDVGTGGGTFVGLEETVDKAMAANTNVRFATTLRAGAHITPSDKLYGLAGYTYGEGPNATHIGAGMEHSFGPLYGKVEYRHYFVEDGARDANAALVGVGMHF